MGIQVETNTDKPVGGRISFKEDERRNGLGRIIFALALAGFVFNVYAFYPGLVSSDSADQYAQALRHAYADWHPPFMAILWSALLPVFPGATGMLLLISASLWGGIGLLAARLCAEFGRRGLLIFAVPFLPVVLNFSGIVWKDVLQATLWLLACGLMIGEAGGKARTRSLFRRTAIVVLVLSGVLVRSNAVFAAMPLLMWEFRDMRPVRSTLAAIACLVLCFGINSLIGKIVTVDHTHPLSSVQTYNLAAISHYTQTNQFPGNWTPEQTEKIERHCYMDTSWNSYAWGDGGPDDCSFVMQELVKQHYWGSSTLTRTWLTQILNHPKAYLRSRLDNYQALLKRPEIRHFIDQAQVIDGGGTLAPASALKPITMLLARYTARGADSRPSAPAYWCVAGAMALVWLTLSWRTASGAARFAHVTLTSALIYVLTYFPAGVASDLRYFYWSYIGISVAVVIVLCDVTRRLQLERLAIGRAPLPLTVLSALLAMTTIVTTWGRI
ncbi:hypothetical protein [Caballeronia ptereochthonis]|uniref:Glycosyltransferase RgtA/B/C/D-like domain-containing protein n=1 Tax=Caballeronia ptereochthonis TaxID=1777144 RepID=A0A158DUQ3_9BURK|nr:hypothetical protein [Caballeronia ptereochthonis]SAK98294.1 hypothetical protein AWB83_05900 [Caballeronia ptereochthonis]